MSHEYLVLDVFTRTPLEGNPLAVFTDAGGLDGALQQRVARELNLSETVFLSPGDEEADAQMRIFTPAAELPFAGHPVLGTAFVVGERTGREEVRLRTGAGVVRVRLRREGNEIVDGEMEQPLPTVEPYADAEGLLAALGIAASELPVEQYVNGPAHLYVTLPDPDAVAALRPDFGALARLTRAGVNCFAQAAGAVVTRNFSAGLGVNEDPATGSAAGPLAVHLLRHGRLEAGRELVIHQGAAIGRPSLLRARVEVEAGEVRRVLVAGGAVVVGRGHYRLG